MKWIYEQRWQDYRRSLRVLIWVMVYVQVSEPLSYPPHKQNSQPGLMLPTGSDRCIIPLGQVGCVRTCICALRQCLTVINKVNRVTAVITWCHGDQKRSGS